MIDAQVDYLVLGCTHYPYLIPLLLEMLPKHVKIIDSGEAVARQTKNILEQNHLLNTSKTNGKSLFYTNGNPEIMSALLGRNLKVEYLNF